MGRRFLKLTGRGQVEETQKDSDEDLVVSLDSEKTKFAKASSDPTSLGNMLVNEGVLTPSEFRQHFKEFKELKESELLGQFLIQRGVVNSDMVELMLIRQKAVRNGQVDQSILDEALQVALRTTVKRDTSVDRLDDSVSKALTLCVAKSIK